MSKSHIYGNPGPVNLDNTSRVYRGYPYYNFTYSPTYSNPVTIDMGVTVDGGPNGGAAVFGSQSWTVVNYGSIIHGYYGVQLTSTSTVINEAGAVITSQNDGVKIDSGTVINSGSIYAETSGIHGTGGGPVTVVNAGYIGSARYGVLLPTGGGSVDNQAGGTIAGYLGVKAGTAGFPGDVIVENAGKIIGTHGVAVQFAGYYDNTLIVDPGATFVGTVVASSHGTNVLELGAGSPTAGQATITGIGSEYVGFQTIQFGSGAQWDVVGTTGDLGAVKFTGFTAGDTIDLTDIYATGESATLDSGTDILTIRDSGGAALGTIQLAGHFRGDSFGVATDGASGTDITVSGPSYYINSTQNGVTLTSPFTNPVTVASDALIKTSETAIYAASDWTIDVAGGVYSSAGAGISLGGGGAVTIETSGYSYGHSSGVHISGAPGTVDVAGNALSGSGDGIDLTAGGSVTVEHSGYVKGRNTAIYVSNAAGTIDNMGTIHAGSQTGVRLQGGGTVTNMSGGSIYGRGNGVQVDSGGTVDNSGYIFGGGNVGIKMDDAGGYIHNRSGGVIASRSRAIDMDVGGSTVVNDAGGMITSRGFGLFLRYGTNLVVNAGTIHAGGAYGINAYGGTIINMASGAISSDYSPGVYITRGTALVDNAGTIGGGASGTAVKLHGDTNRLIVHAGAEFDGNVIARNGAMNSMELAAGPFAGTIVGFGSDGKYQQFHGVTIDAGGHWGIAGTQSGINEGEFYGFQAGDSLDLTDFAFNPTYTATASGNLLTVTDAGGNIREVAGLFGNFTGHTFNLADDHNGGTYILEDGVACYLRGTRVMTDHGPVAVEDLKIGDMLVTPEGLQPLKWVGRRAYAGWLAAGNPHIQPVRFKTGSLADNVPCRDLLVSPEHAMFVDGVLIPARHLVNGTSIVKAAAMDEIQYFHLELDRHSVIFAEDAASETFVDDDSRGMFNNANEFRKLYPDTPRNADAEYCAPRVEDGYQLEAVRRVLNARAARLLPDGTTASSMLQGYLDSVSPTSVEGWAYDPATPDQPVTLVVIADGAVIGRVLANGHRQGLADAGFGDGCHAFSFDLPQGFAPGIAHVIEVRRESDWSPLADSPMVLKADGSDFVSLSTGIGAYRVGIA